MRSNINRREVIGGAIALSGIAMLPNAALALNEAQANSLIQQVTSEIQSIINSGQSESQMLVQFEGIFRNYADVPRIAGTCLGAAWRTASSGEKSSYVAAFQHYISYKYGRQFRSFQGAKIDLVRSRDSGDRGVLVESMVDTRNSSPFVVEWHVIDAGGRPKFFNLIIEGISLLASEREEIGAMLAASRGDIAQLNARLLAT